MLQIEKASTWHYDLKVGQNAENCLASILQNSTIEVKFDKYKNSTYFIELISLRYDEECKCKRYVKSGLASTTSDYYTLMKNNLFVIISTQDLKDLIKDKARKLGIKINDLLVTGGYEGRVKGCLITIDEITDYLDKTRVYKENIDCLVC